MGKEKNIIGMVFQNLRENNSRRKGKRYTNSIEKSIFEGEFFFDKRWTGKGYDDEGNIIYELKDGTGNIKEFHKNGQIKFDGVCIKGILSGYGKEYDENGNLIFEGEYKYGEKRSGTLKQYSNKELIFEAEVKEGKISN